MAIYDFDCIDIVCSDENGRLMLVMVDPDLLVDEDRDYAFLRKLSTYKAALQNPEFRKEHSAIDNVVVSVDSLGAPSELMLQTTSIEYEVNGTKLVAPVEVKVRERAYKTAEEIEKGYLVEVSYNYEKVVRYAVETARTYIQNGCFTPFGLAWSDNGEMRMINVDLNSADEQLEVVRASLQEASSSDKSVQVVARVYDVFAVHPEESEKSDAIAIEVAHRQGQPMSMYSHYAILDGEVQTRRTYGFPSKNDLFVATEDSAIEPQAESESQHDDGESSLDSSPNICFLLVSGIDGDIDKKETEAFMKALKGATEHLNPLVRKVFVAAASRFGEDLQEMMQLGQSAMVVLPLRLAECRAHANKNFPEHADEFFRVLIEMSTSIASASGGFLGFGNSISKAERAALDLIESLLLGKN